MGNNGIVVNDPARLDFKAETRAAMLKRETDEKMRLEAQRIEHQRYLEETAAKGIVLEAGEMLAEVEGFRGPISQAPALTSSAKPPTEKQALWVKKLECGEKATFLVYAPAFYGYYTHYRGEGRGTVLCFEDHSLCQGGHDDSTMRWHGVLHCFHYEDNRQCFMHFTPEAADCLANLVADGMTYRGLKVLMRRSDKKKGPYKVEVLGEAQVSHAKLPRHRDAKASIYRFYKITPKGKMLHAALSGGEDIPDGAS